MAAMLLLSAVGAEAVEEEQAEQGQTSEEYKKAVGKFSREADIGLCMQLAQFIPYDAINQRLAESKRMGKLAESPERGKEVVVALRRRPSCFCRCFWRCATTKVRGCPKAKSKRF